MKILASILLITALLSCNQQELPSQANDNAKKTTIPSEYVDEFEAVCFYPKVSQLSLDKCLENKKEVFLEYVELGNDPVDVFNFLYDLTKSRIDNYTNYYCVWNVMNCYSSADTIFKRDYLDYY